MHKTTIILILGVALAVLKPIPAASELIYVSEFEMAGERSDLAFRFQGPADENGQIAMEIFFGNGLSAKLLKIRIAQVKDPVKFRTMVKSLLNSLNNQNNVYIELKAALKIAGFTFK